VRAKNFWPGLGQVNFLWLGSAIYVLVWIWKISLKMSNFSIFSFWIQKKYLRVGSKSTWVKGVSASYLLRIKSKLGPGQDPSLLIINLFVIHIWFQKSGNILGEFHFPRYKFNLQTKSYDISTSSTATPATLFDWWTRGQTIIPLNQILVAWNSLKKLAWMFH